MSKSSFKEKLNVIFNEKHGLGEKKL